MLKLSTMIDFSVFLYLHPFLCIYFQPLNRQSRDCFVFDKYLVLTDLYPLYPSLSLVVSFVWKFLNLILI